MRFRRSAREHLTVQSVAEQGTTCTITLPRTVAEAHNGMHV